MAHRLTTPISARRATLVARQNDLVARLGAIETELEAHHDADWDDLAITREDDEVLEANGLSGQHELRQISAALGRMDKGHYGQCAKCGADIGEDRLDVLPYTPFCRTCAT